MMEEYRIRLEKWRENVEEATNRLSLALEENDKRMNVWWTNIQQRVYDELKGVVSHISTIPEEIENHIDELHERKEELENKTNMIKDFTIKSTELFHHLDHEKRSSHELTTSSLLSTVTTPVAIVKSVKQSGSNSRSDDGDGDNGSLLMNGNISLPTLFSNDQVNTTTTKPSLHSSNLLMLGSNSSNSSPVKNSSKIGSVGIKRKEMIESKSFEHNPKSLKLK